VAEAAVGAAVDLAEAEVEVAERIGRDGGARLNEEREDLRPLRHPAHAHASPRPPQRAQQAGGAAACASSAAAAEAPPEAAAAAAAGGSSGESKACMGERPCASSTWAGAPARSSIVICIACDISMILIMLLL